MEFSEIVKKRRSIRKYQNKEIDEAVLRKILEACGLAPSAGHLQAYKIFIAKDSETKKKLAEASLGQDFVAQADVDIVFFANPAESSQKYGQRGESLYCIQDATIAAAYAQLAAVDLGLDCAWVGAFDPEEVIKICGLAGKNLIPVAIIPIGFGDPDYERRVFDRKSVGEIII